MPIHDSADVATVVMKPAITNWRSRGPLGVPINENIQLPYLKTFIPAFLEKIHLAFTKWRDSGIYKHKLSIMNIMPSTILGTP